MSKFLDLSGVTNLWNKVKSRIVTDINSNVTSKIGVANGIASLGSNAKLPVSQLPALKTINNNSIVGEGNISIDLSLYKIVNSLPTANIDVNKIYLVLSEAGSSSNGNIYTEYIYVNNKWEEIGKYKAKVDLTNYVTFDDVATSSNKGLMIPSQYSFLSKFIDSLAYTGVLAINYYTKRNPFEQKPDNVTLKYNAVSSSGQLYTNVPCTIDSVTDTLAGVMLPAHKKSLDSLVEDQKDSYSVRLKLDSIQQKNIIEATISESLGRFANQQKINGGRYKAIAINTYIEADDAIIEIMPIVSPVKISAGDQDDRVMLSYDIKFTYYQTSTDGNQTVSDARATIKIIFDSDGNVVDKGFMGMIGIPTLSDAQYNILKDLEDNTYSMIADESLGYEADVVKIPVTAPGSGDVQNILINSATSTEAGVMTADDKIKLDNLHEEFLIRTDYNDENGRITAVQEDIDKLFAYVDNNKLQSSVLYVPVRIIGDVSYTGAIKFLEDYSSFYVNVQYLAPNVESFGFATYNFNRDGSVERFNHHHRDNIVENISINGTKLVYPDWSIGNDYPVIDIPLASPSVNGAMPSADKVKLNNIAANATKDEAISTVELNSILV